tara:strand:- start:1706 stop:1942 length:237 start_codon:yes stop_codon:yes gene_type:complete
MTKQQISSEAKQEVLRLLEDRITTYEGLDISKAVLAVNLTILEEENEDLKNQIENIKSEIEILTGDLRATASALDDLE